MRKIAFFTLGCKVNQYETEAISEMFKAKNYDIVDFEQFADIYLINTCTVTGMSDRKSRQMIRRAKKINPDSVIIVTGCYAQTAADDLLAIDGVNMVIGTRDRSNIVSLANSLTHQSKVNAVGNIMDAHVFENLHIDEYSERTRAYVKVQEGCNQFCSYCIIPYARGPIRSRDEESVIKEVERIVAKGFKEIVLAGIHVASYGFDLGNTDLSKLLQSINKIDGLERIRLSSIEPMAINSEFVESVKNLEKLCHHFHISLQSGCDETLKRMNRKYTTDEFRCIVEGLRKSFDDVSITTDIMVGFPGESDEEFNKSLEFAKQIQFCESHIFQYSPRKNTPAAEMDNQIAPDVKHERSKLMIEVAHKSKKEFIEKFIGSKQKVLFEQPFGKHGYYQGKTNNYINVIVKSSENIEGQMLEVLLDKINGDNIEGTII